MPSPQSGISGWMFASNPVDSFSTFAASMDSGSASGKGGGARGEETVRRALFGLPSSHDSSGSQDAIDIAHRATEEMRAAAQLMQDAQRIANFGSWEWLLADDTVSWSDQLYRIFGFDPPNGTRTFEVTLATYLDRVHADDRDRIQAAIERALSDRKPFRFEHRIVRPTGEIRMVRCQGEPVVDSATARIARVVGVCQDVTELASVEQARSEADARFRSAFENAPIGIALIDFGEGSDGRLTEVNRALCELTTRTSNDLIGATMTRLCLREDADLDQSMRERLVAGELDRYTVEKRALLNDDRLVWLQLSVSAIPESAPGNRTGIVQIQDVTERKRFEEQLRYIADHDSLTGLANRRRFREELDSHLALLRRYGGGGALLLVDVDRLKAVNDTRGHGAGDVVLRRVAEAMRTRVRNTDIVARLAGDEFAVLLPNAAPNEAEAVAEALIARLAGEEVAGWGVSISVGVAPFAGPEVGSSEDVMAVADEAMYRAKQRGGAVAEVADSNPPPENHAAPGDPHSHDLASRRSAKGVGRFRQNDEAPARQADAQLPMAARVRKALAAGTLLVYGQPVIDLRSGRIAHHELLIRMTDEDSGEVLAASDFLGAAAQEPGLCQEIDRWVVEKTVGMLTNGCRGSRFQVNVSGETFGDDAMLTRISEAVSEAGIEPGSLGFEIGEESIRRDPGRAAEALERLAAHGCPVVLDGFTAGFGSFEYVQRLPLDQIKIDGTVVRALIADEPDHATLGAIVRLAHGTGKMTVAKLVETGEIVPMLRMHGVDMAQGYELGEPVALGA
jgi:diguanylate cyclase (GGDEF)-like protein/PAS domain S-box-containing protein